MQRECVWSVTYASCHLGAEDGVLIVIPHRYQVVSDGVEADGLVERSLLVRRSYGPHLSQDVRVIGDQSVGSNTCERSYGFAPPLWSAFGTLCFACRNRCDRSCLNSCDGSPAAVMFGRWLCLVGRASVLTIRFNRILQRKVHVAVHGVTKHPPAGQAGAGRARDMSKPAP